MTTSRRLALLVSSLLLAAACVTGGASRRGGLPRAQVEAYPPDIQAAYQLFAQRCSRCHTLSRPLGADIYDMEHWRDYVNRMRRQRGSGISPKDATVILHFLGHYAREKAKEDGVAFDPLEAPPATTTATTGGAL